MTRNAAKPMRFVQRLGEMLSPRRTSSSNIEVSPTDRGVPWIEELLPYVKTEGTCAIDIDGHTVRFDLRHPHERAYVLKALLNVRHPQSDIDTQLLNRLLQAGDRVLDAGANIGMTALECVKFGASHVVAVEADPSLYERLSALDSERIVPVAAAISHAAGHADLLLSQTHNQGATLSNAHSERFAAVYGTSKTYVRVPTIAIDSLVRQHGNFDVWKLDIEGAEADALRGAKETLARTPPRQIMAELFPHVFEEFVDLIGDTHPYGYRALLRIADYHLVLVGLREEPCSQYCHTSPTYVFSQTPLSFSEYT